MAVAGRTERPALRRALLEQGVGRAEARGLEAVVSRGLAAEPEQRIASIEELVAGLDQALQPSFGSRIVGLLERLLRR
jgi:hypothetical protein